MGGSAKGRNAGEQKRRAAQDLHAQARRDDQAAVVGGG